MIRHNITIFFAAALLICACKPDSVHYQIDKTQATLKVDLSSTNLELDSDAESETAMIISCSNLEGISLKYAYKMDLQVNNFVDATDLVEMTDGRAELTHGHLNNFLVNRGVNGGENSTEVAIRVVGTEINKDKYLKPVYKDTIILVRGYVAGPEKTVENVYILGDACDAGWNIGSPIKMEQENEDVKVFTWRGLLYPRGTRYSGNEEDDKTYIEGTLKFPVRTGAWDCPFFMAPRTNTLASGTVNMVYAENGQPDTKYLVNTYGLYSITLDVKNMKVTFALEDAYSDLDIKRVWMVGDATPGGWHSRPFRIELDHSTTDRHIFTWEGELTKGTLKFPIHHTAFEVATIRPVETATIDKDHPAPVADGSIQNAPEGSDDIKWEVTDETAGNYKITINTENMTIKFEKK